MINFLKLGSVKYIYQYFDISLKYCYICKCLMKMQKFKKPDIDPTKIGVNPFVNSLSIKVVRKYASNEYNKDEEGLITNKEFKLETKEYTKLFVGSEERKIISNLNDNAKALLLWIMYELETGKDYLWINRLRYMEENNIKSPNTFNTPLRELVRYGFITQTIIKDVYWINPEFMFNGNRIKKYPNNLVIKNASDNKENE